MSATPDLEGYEDWLAKFIPTLSPEQRLAGLEPEHLVLALPDEALRALALAPSYLATLPVEVQATIRARLQGQPAAASRKRHKKG